MTITALRAPTQQHSSGTPASAVAGTATLIRFILRRERVKLTAWVLGISVLLNYFLNVMMPEVAGTEAGRADLRRYMDGPMAAVMGPGYGRDDVTIERYVSGVYGLFFFLLVALMSIQLMSRQTRVEEQSGRAELIRSNVVGRHAHLTAALAVAVGANLLLVCLIAGSMAMAGYGGSDALLFGASVGAVGLVFTGIAAITVQVTEFSRTANGIAGAVLGAAWAVRFTGDMIEDYGSPLSWLSPLAWSNQTRPYVDGRWWPLLLSVGLAFVAAGLGFVLSARRDVGGSLVAARAGAAAAAPWLTSSLTFAFRLQRSSLLWWTGAISAFGLMFGSFAEMIADPEDMSEQRIEMFGGSLDTLVDGYLGMITFFWVSLAGVMVMLGVQALRTEETKGRAEPVLATGVSRTGWFGSYLTVISVGMVGMLLIVGLAMGIGVWLATDDGSYVGEMVLAHVAHAPGVLVLLGVTALLFAVLPRAIGLTWVVVGYSLFVGMFGEVADLPQWALDLVPMQHTGRPPLDGISWEPLTALGAIGVSLMALALAAFSRRDLESK
jgi:ABC-2 type transport system permease protein